VCTLVWRGHQAVLGLKKSAQMIGVKGITTEFEVGYFFEDILSFCFASNWG
jgi:hypothetical protein